MKKLIFLFLAESFYAGPIIFLKKENEWSYKELLKLFNN